MNNCEFGQQNTDHLGRSISIAGIAPIEYRVTDDVQMLKFPNAVKALLNFTTGEKTAVPHEIP